MTTTNHSVNQVRRLAKAYYIAKQSVLEKGYAPEIDWQYEVSIDRINEKTFLCEAAWVILSSGMRESVIRKKFLDISNAFFNWNSAYKITENASYCRSRALQHFKNKAKIDAILVLTKQIYIQGFDKILENLLKNGIEYLQQFPFLGPATSFHLAKNIGVSCAKPDRHLCRIAEIFGYNCVQSLCNDISNITEEPMPVIDLVLWRYSTLHRNYLEHFSDLVFETVSDT